MHHLKIVTLLALVAAAAPAQDKKTTYPNVAPLDQYMMERNAEIALARSAAPESISKDADVLVMGRQTYETAVHGKNGFVCLVERGWTAPADDPNFWNPKLRGPLCLNPAAARTYLPLTIRKTELILAGKTKAQMMEALKAAFVKKEFPTIEAGAMCYMLSKQGYLDDNAGHWHPHLMFFTPLADAESWGAGSEGSPLLAAKVADDHLTIFMLPVAKWSDGSADATHDH